MANERMDQKDTPLAEWGRALAITDIFTVADPTPGPGLGRMAKITGNEVLVNATNLVAGFIPAARYQDSTITFTKMVYPGGTTNFLRSDGSWAVPPGSGLADPMTDIGDIIIRNALNNTARLAAGTEGQVLKMTGGLPSWANETGGGGGGITALTGDVTASGSGSVAATIATNAVTNAKFRQSAGLSVVGNNTDSTANVADITASTDHAVLRRNGSFLGFGLITDNNITSNTITYGKIQAVNPSRLIGRYSAAGGTIQEITIGSGLALDSGTGVLSATGGGGGMADPMTTIGDIIIRNGSNVTARLGIGSAGQVLTVNSGVPSWQNASSGFADPMTTAGDIIIRNISNATTRLGAGANGTVLTMVSGVPAWAALGGGGGENLDATLAIGGTLTANRTINTSTFSLTLTGGDTSSGTPMFIWDDDIPVTVASPKQKVRMEFKPLHQAQTGSFYFNQYANRLTNDTTSLVNEVFSFGWNMSPGIGQVIGSKAMMGMSFERSWDNDGDGANPWQEIHLISTTAAGQHRRLFSYTMPETDESVDFYHTTHTFYIKNPTLLGDPDEGIWWNANPGNTILTGPIGEGSAHFRMERREDTTERFTIDLAEPGDTTLGTKRHFAITSSTPGSNFVLTNFELQATDAQFTGFVSVAAPGGSPSSGLGITSSDSTYANLSLTSDAGTAQIVHDAAASSGNVRFYNNGTAGNFQFINDNGTHLIIGNTGLITIATIKITGGTPGVGKVLTSDADGDASWQDPSGGGGVSGLTTNFIPKATGATTMTSSRIFDDGTDVIITSNNFYLKNGSNNLVSAVVTATEGTYVWRGDTGTTPLGWQMVVSDDADSITFSAVDATASTDVTYNGMRNINFQPTGVFQVATEVHASGSIGAFAFDDQVTASKTSYLLRETGVTKIQGTRHSDGTTTTPVAINNDAPDNSFNMLAGGAVLLSEAGDDGTGAVLQLGGSISTDPVASNRTDWLLGELFTGSTGIAIDATKYVTIKVNGTTVNLAVAVLP